MKRIECLTLKRIQWFGTHHQGSLYFKKYPLNKIHLIRKKAIMKWQHCLFLKKSYLLWNFYQASYLRKAKSWNRNTFKPKISNISWGFVTISKQNTLTKLKLVNPQNFPVSGRKYEEATHYDTRCSIKGNLGHQKIPFPISWKKHWRDHIYF